MTRILILVFLTFTIATQAQNVVPFLKKNGKYILVDAATMKPSPNTTEFDEADELEGGFWQLCNGENCGLYNRFGKQLMKPKKLIFKERLQGNVFKTFQGEGSDPITGLYGLVDTTGVELIPVKYASIWDFADGLASFSTNAMKKGFIDKKGKVVIEGIKGNVYTFSNGVAKINDYLPDNSTLNYYIDKTGKPVLKPSMKNVEWYEDFFEGLASFKQKSTGLIGLIDKKGQIVVQPKFQDISYFNKGLAAAKTNNKYGFINKNGVFVIPNEYDEFKSFEKELILVKKGTFYGAINTKGSEIIPFKYKEIYEYKEGLLIFNNEDTYDFYNSDGKLFFSTTKSDNNNIGSFNYGYAVITMPKETLLINVQGKQIKIPNDKNDGFIAKTPNYIHVRYSGGSEFKNYFMSLEGKVYKEQ